MLLPVPAWVLTAAAPRALAAAAFSITPVFFNVGINEQQTIADRLGHNAPQERSNADNLRVLADYARRYRSCPEVRAAADTSRAHSASKDEMRNN